MLSTLYIVRHATPDLTQAVDYKIPPGPDLTAIGREQAREAGLYLANCAVERVYTSPLQRAYQTAGAIAAQTRLLQIVDDRLAEHRGDETRDDVKKRVAAFLHDVIHDDARVVACASHGSPVRMMLETLAPKIDLKPFETQVGNPSVPAGIWRASKVEGGWLLDYVFEPSQLPWDNRKDNRPLIEKIGHAIRRLL